MLITLTLLTTLSAPAAAADPVLDALEAELNRASEELALEGAERPYYIAYRLLDVHRVGMTAQLGGLVGYAEQPDRDLGVEVRVGSEVFDNSNFQSNPYDNDNGFGSTSLVIDDAPMALRHDAWLETDTCYKQAVETLATKQAAARRRAAGDELPDYVPGPSQSADGGAEPPPDAESMKARALQLSEVFLDRPEVERSVVYSSSETGRRATLDSAGTRVVEPVGELNVRVIARGRSEDGATVVDHASWTVRGESWLPDTETMVAEAEALADRVEAWRELPLFEEEYVGPVLFEDDAAVDLFRYLLLPALQGTPPPEQPSQGSRVIAFSRNTGPSSSTLQVRRRVLPPGFNVVDDPKADAGLPSAYAYDMEGEPAEAITLVRDGIVRTHYASRTPGQGAETSNGHGRGALNRLIRGQAAITTVEAGRPDRARRVRREAMQLAASYDLDHYLVVRRLSDPSLAGEGGGAMMNIGGSSGPALPAPLAVYRVYADGREEALRGAAFASVDARLLRDIVAVGQAQTRTFLQPLDSRGARALGGMPTTLTAPDVLVSEVVLSPSRADVERPPKLPNPLGKPLADGE